MNRTMTADLIVDFPHKRNHQAVRFAHMAQVHVVTRHCETHNVARHELWYTESDYHRMRLDAKTRKRLALLRAQRSSVSFTKNQMRSSADERRQNVLLSLEPNIILPLYPVQYVTEICNRMSRAS
uniref:Uncharacterized protein n=1 Tax=Skeletonema marinoi TaxID=267567 RepID=A0A7S2LSR7_9STRA|mmetsp:Transcript_29077/g.49545  ORF Transcript_29077/g.49545 Transcript_29077/m.49545 type:complete len:125 (+) Transcript_29077:77-451(+)